jgi:hypothetical protein
VLGNWNLSSFMFYQSGYPMGVVDTGYQNYLFAGTPRPNVTTNDWRAPTAGERFDPSVDLFFNPAVFQRRTNPQADPFGNAPRLDGATRAFRTFRTNIAIAKDIPVWERVKMDFRLDIFDLFNQKTWANPVTDLANSQFGVITNANGSRSMQLGLKAVF